MSGLLDWRGTGARASVWGPALIVVALIAVGLSVVPENPLGWPARLTFVVLGIACFVLWRGVFRRLAALGWSGWWSLLVPVSPVNLLLILPLAVLRDRPGGGERSAAARRTTLALALLLSMLFISRAFWAPLSIPSGSMKPTLPVGDIVLALPGRSAEPGRVAVYVHPSGALWLGRIIAGPGQTVQLAEGVPVVDGTRLDQRDPEPFIETFDRQGPFDLFPRCANAPVPLGGACEKTALTETLGGRSYRVLDIEKTALDNTPVFTVPEGHVFIMGGNRDNSTDSRMPQQVGGPGFIPVAALRGRVIRVIWPGAGEGRAWEPVR